MLAYYVLSSSIQVKGRGEEHILNAGDLVHFTAGQEGLLKINGQAPASISVSVMADSPV
jgi:quercetin dioxygenase-like cupin family protein